MAHFKAFLSKHLCKWMLKINFYGVIRLMNFARWIFKKISLYFCLYHLEVLFSFAALNVTVHLSKIHLSNYRHYRSLSVVGPVKYFLVDTLCNKLKNRIDDTQFKAKLVQNQTQPFQFSFRFGRNKFCHLSVRQLAVPNIGMEFLRCLAEWYFRLLLTEKGKYLW